MPRATGCVKTGCNRSFVVRSILSNGGNCNLCLVATYLQVQSSCSLFRVAQLDFQTLAELSAALAEFTAEAEALESTSLAEAQRHPDWPQWEAGIQEELVTLHAAGTWELADLPAGANLVGSKWVFRAKKDAAGHIVCHKARLVAQGFS
jgi:hypothetical protein